MMYWSVIGDHSHIEESAMDGSLRRVLLEKNLRRPTGGYFMSIIFPYVSPRGPFHSLRALGGLLKTEMFRLTSFVFLHVTLWLDTHVWSPSNAHIDSVCTDVVPIEFNHSLQRLRMRELKKKNNPFTCSVVSFCSIPDNSTVSRGCCWVFTRDWNDCRVWSCRLCISHDVRIQGSCIQKMESERVGIHMLSKQTQRCSLAHLNFVS